MVGSNDFPSVNDFILSVDAQHDSTFEPLLNLYRNRKWKEEFCINNVSIKLIWLTRNEPLWILALKAQQLGRYLGPRQYLNRKYVSAISDSKLPRTWVLPAAAALIVTSQYWLYGWRSKFSPGKWKTLLRAQRVHSFCISSDPAIQDSHASGYTLSQLLKRGESKTCAPFWRHLGTCKILIGDSQI